MEILASIFTSFYLTVAGVLSMFGVVDQPEPIVTVPEIQSPVVEERVKQTKSVEEDVVSTSFATKVGSYEVSVVCKNLNPVQIKVSLGSEYVQKIDVRAGTSGVQTCPSVTQQDVNFDDYPDFLLLVGTGSGGSMESYWLYNPIQKIFECNNGPLGCVLANPEFDEENKLVRAHIQMGAGNIHWTIYKIVEGKLVVTDEQWPN